MPTRLTLGLARTPRTQALFDQTVESHNIRLECREHFSTGYDNTGARHRLILDGTIPGGEMSTSSYILARARGAAHRYNSTTAVWVRGLLQNEYGVGPEDMTWEIVEKDLGKEAEVAKPKGVRIGLIPEPRTRENAIRRVESGQIDAALEPYSDLGRNPKLRRILKDHRKEEEAYFKRTGVIPVIHTLVLQEKIVEENPEIVKSLMAAFRKAHEMEDSNASPEEREEAQWMRGFVGHDPYSYRLDPCARRSLETLIEYQLQQGLLNFEPNVDDLFFPNSIEDAD